MSTVAIIEARMGSTRLPGKVLAQTAGRPLLAHMIERLDRCEHLDGIVVATTTSPADDPIVELVGGSEHHEHVGWYRGSEHDVLDRVLQAARQRNVDVIVEVTADCPLIDPRIVDETIVRFHKRKPDFCWTIGYPTGMEVRVFRTDTLAEIDKLTDDPADREHVSLYFWEHPEQFAIETVSADPIHRDDTALVVDTPDDLALVREIFASLYPRFPTFGLSEILLLLHAQPWLRDINRRVSRKPVRQTAI